MLNSLFRRRNLPVSAWWRAGLASLVLLSLLGGLLSLSACGGSGKDEDAVLAKVGEREVKASYYQKKLAKMTEADLPRDDAGEPVDTSTLEGKRAFLDVLINKDLCYLQGEKMGYLKDPQIAGARAAMIDYEAGLKLWETAVGEPSRFISNEELEAFYERWGEVRTCEYLMTNFEQDALDARQAVLSGLPWAEAVQSYHDGPPAPRGKYEINVAYGQYGLEFESGIFSVKEGEVSLPIRTPNGYWLVRVNKVESKPKSGLDKVRDKIIELKYNRKLYELRENFKLEVQDRAGLTFHDDALLKAWQGLPADEQMFRPGTKDPVPREELKPLQVEPKDMDLPFYSYKVRGELREATLGDFKAHFDRMNVFQRPKKSNLIGGLKNSITQELTMVFLKEEAERRGLDKDPEVVAKVDEKIEEMIVSKIFREVVHFDETVTPLDAEAYWAQHKDEYELGEGRRGHVVKVRDRGRAQEAVAAARDGVEWSRILELYGIDEENKARGGFYDFIYQRTPDPVTSALFDLQEAGQVGEPINLPDGLLAVVKLDEIVPPRSRELSEVIEDVGLKIRARRQDDAFNALLDEWTADFGVEIFEDKLLETPSWQDLQAQAVAAAGTEPEKE